MLEGNEGDRRRRKKRRKEEGLSRTLHVSPSSSCTVKAHTQWSSTKYLITKFHALSKVMEVLYQIHLTYRFSNLEHLRFKQKKELT